MSDNWIMIVPKQPKHVPSSNNIQTAIEVLNHIAPDADEIEAIEKEKVQFFDCGANLETVSCPECQSDVGIDWWSDAMSEDFDITRGFQLNEYIVPCCSSSLPLNALNYSFHQAFGRFALSAMNANIGLISISDVKKIESALECEVSVVYQHI